MDGHTARFPSQTQTLESPQDSINQEQKGLFQQTLSKYGNIFIAADSSLGYKRFTRYNTGTYITRTNISGKMERHKEKTNESLQKHEEVVATGEGILKR